MQYETTTLRVWPITGFDIEDHIRDKGAGRRLVTIVTPPNPRPDWAWPVFVWEETTP